MTASYEEVFENNRRWVERRKAGDPEFFRKLATEQKPGWLWIGCSDSRVLANEVTGLEPGDLFVHRNIANLVPNTDLNSQSVIEYAVGTLNISHIVVCGHYGCGGIKAALEPKDAGLLNPWLRNVRDVYRLHSQELNAIKDPVRRNDRFVEINVLEQCRNVLKTAVVQRSFLRSRTPMVHGWVYDINNGLIRDLNVDTEALLTQLREVYALMPD